MGSYFTRIKTPKTDLKMIASSYYIPKFNESRPLGEDAHFICNDSQVIGVSDGVGGCSSFGIDAGEYARELMRNATYTVGLSKSDDTHVDIDPKEVLTKAYLSSKSRGAATACILSLSQEGNILRAANVGDSGFCVIRDGKTFYTSPVQHYGLNCPYQLQYSSDISAVDVAEEIEVMVECGDVIVAGTDGLFDNMFPKDIEEMVEYCLQGNKSQEFLACSLAEAAWQRSRDGTRNTPFAVVASEAGFQYSGGKYDDITVVVAFVVPLYDSIQVVISN